MMLAILILAGVGDVVALMILWRLHTIDSRLNSVAELLWALLGRDEVSSLGVKQRRPK
jgi:hypothetical protein